KHDGLPHWSDRVEKPMWGRLATCAAVGYRRRSTAKAAGADCQSAAGYQPGYQPAPQNLVRQPTPAQFFMGFRGPKAHSNRRQKAIVCPASAALRRGGRMTPRLGAWEPKRLRYGGCCDEGLAETNGQ